MIPSRISPVSKTQLRKLSEQRSRLLSALNELSKTTALAKAKLSEVEKELAEIHQRIAAGAEIE